MRITDPNQTAVLTDVFNLMPGLVIEEVGLPAIVTSVIRDSDHETVTFTTNSPAGDSTIVRSWADGHMVRVIGLAVDCEIENVDLFDS